MDTLTEAEIAELERKLDEIHNDYLEGGPHVRYDDLRDICVKLLRAARSDAAWRKAVEELRNNWPVEEAAIQRRIRARHDELMKGTDDATDTPTSQRGR